MQHARKMKPTAVARILDAADTCFGESGYRGASMADIARGAGVAKSLLHYHFESKEAIFLQVQTRIFEEILERVSNPGVLEADPLGALKGALRTVYDELQREPRRMRVLLEVHMGTSGEGRQRLAWFSDKVEALIIAGLNSTLGRASGQSALNAESLAPVLLLLFRGVIVELATAESVEDKERVREVFELSIELLEKALVADFGGKE